jgi:hypothetical protein
MAFGLQIVNPSGELVLSSDAYLPVYLGRATLVSTTQPTSSGGSTGIGSGGISTFTFSYSGQIIPVLQLPPGALGGIYKCSQAGSTWTILASFTDGAQISDAGLASFSMYLQAPPTVFVFGFVNSLGGSFGAAIYNAAGQLTGDLTRRPLIVRQHASLAAGATSFSLVGGIVSPGIIGRLTDYQGTGGPTGVPELFRVAQHNAFLRNSGDALTRVWDRRRLSNTGIDTILTRSDRLEVWVAETNGLP